MPSDALIRKEFIENFKGFFTFIPLFGILFYYVFNIGRFQSKEEKDKETGWAHLRFSGSIPSVTQQITTIGAAYLIYDALFYWSHRILHNPSLFLKIHRIHHRFKTPVGISASYSEAYESLLQTLIWWLPLGAAGYLHKDLHVSTVYWYTIFRWIETVEAHSGYDIWWHPVRLIWITSGARCHDYHHSHFDGNYGATKIWDWLMGTNKDYLEYLRSKNLTEK